VSRPLILVTNDDGIDAPGLLALADSVASLGQVWVVAPEKQQSAMSHALTLHKPLRLYGEGERRYAVSGTPTDCVFVGVLHLMPERPAVVLSGVNRGANLGDDVSYSGTVSAALEAAIMGIPGIALSHVDYRSPDYRDGVDFARQLAEQVLRDGLPKGKYLNVNFPSAPRGGIKGVRVTRLGQRYYADTIVECTDPRGRPYFWIGGKDPQFNDIPGSDCNAVHEGYISVTPLHSDPTDHDGLDTLRGWGLERG
jgi:5'-nucleotidase